MGHELRRMLAETAPATWTANMRLVAFEVADRAPDPSQAKSGDMPPDGGGIRSRVLLTGHLSRRGEYVRGLTDYCGMNERTISRALQDLAAEGYEMRVQILGRDGEPLVDAKGRPVFACRGHAMTFRVPPTVSLGVRSDTQTSERVSDLTPKGGERVSDLTPLFPTTDLSLQKPSPSYIASDLTGSVEGDTATSGREQFEAARRRMTRDRRPA